MRKIDEHIIVCAALGCFTLSVRTTHLHCGAQWKWQSGCIEKIIGDSVKRGWQQGGMLFAGIGVTPRCWKFSGRFFNPFEAFGIARVSTVRHLPTRGAFELSAIWKRFTRLAATAERDWDESRGRYSRRKRDAIKGTSWIPTRTSTVPVLLVTNLYFNCLVTTRAYTSLLTRSFFVREKEKTCHPWVRMNVRFAEEGSRKVVFLIYFQLCCPFTGVRISYIFSCVSLKLHSYIKYIKAVTLPVLEAF